MRYIPIAVVFILVFLHAESHHNKKIEVLQVEVDELSSKIDILANCAKAQAEISKQLAEEVYGVESNDRYMGRKSWIPTDSTPNYL